MPSNATAHLHDPPPPLPSIRALLWETRPSCPIGLALCRIGDTAFQEFTFMRLGQEGQEKTGAIGSPGLWLGHAESSISTAYWLASNRPGTTGRSSVGVARGVCGPHSEGVGAVGQTCVLFG